MRQLIKPLLAACALALATVSASAQTVDGDDFLMFGGTIVTNPNGATVEALIVRDGKVVFAGALPQAREAAKDLPKIDLNGATALPGFTDSHVHLTGVGLREMTLNLDQVKSVAELVAAVKAHDAANPGADPIVGRGWIETHWPEQRFPTRADLDAVVKDRPVVLERADGHAMVLNSAALALAGIGRAMADPPGGRIERGAQGEPTGMLIDTAMNLIEAKLPPLSDARRREALKRAVDRYASLGWTRAVNMSTAAKDVDVLFALAAEGQLPIFVDVFMTPEDSAEVLKRGPYADPTGKVRVRGVKLYMDGALGSRGALLLAPYSDKPETSGLQIADEAQTKALLRQALKVGADIAFHAIGDKGNRLALDWMAAVLAEDPAAAKKVRWRIEHAQILDPADFKRFEEIPIVASMQPSHAIGDLYFAPSRLGPDRLVGAYAWKSLFEAGAFLVGGSDAPVEVGDPRIEYYAATIRKDLKGQSGPDWRPQEALHPQFALSMFTSMPAYVDHLPDAGTLLVGKRADITVFSLDIYKSPEKTMQARPVLTIVSGRIVFDGR